MSNKTIIKGYSQAGDEFLAEKLKKVFQILDTPAKVALHNDMVDDVLRMVGNDLSELRTNVARTLIKRPKNFLLRVAELIRNLSLRNIQDGK